MSSPQSMSVDQVAVAFYSLATSLFLLDANSFSGSLDEKFRDEDRSYIWLWSFPVKMRELYDGIFSKRAPHFEHLPDFCCMMVRDFCGGCRFEDLGQDQLKQVISRVSQLITSRSYKARQRCSNFTFNSVSYYVMLFH
ncbi:uncharacterized protein [Primulina eburnea]|uniref:uncharacterized protein isoform X3 n=1 Tax=Primulina eburnea TaxID=1245227 RepID=UPI003C6C32C4